MSTSSSNHLSFNCVSGELLWGQLHCICEGYFNRLHNEYDTPQSVPELLSGGTIKQRSYRYRCRAAKGEWQAKLYRARFDSESESSDSGYIIYNIHYNPTEILRRCAAVGQSLDQSHTDRSIIYINRYDWSWHHDYEFESKINRLLRINNLNDGDDDDYSPRKLFAGCIITIDSDSAMNVIQQLKSNPAEFIRSQEKVFIESRNESNKQVGLYLSMPETDYELAWLVFSSDQSDSELIAIVYDGSYIGLDAQITLDQEDVVSWKEYKSKQEDEARRAADIWKRLQSGADIRTLMNNRGDKNIEQSANGFIAQGLTCGDGTDVDQRN